MKITRLHLKNFRVHRDSVLQIGNSSFVVIRGRNFAGKTTIGQGLSMCLAVTTAGLDQQGRGFATKIRRGESEAVIEADIQTKRHLMRRTVTLSSGVAGRSQRSVSLTDPEWNADPFDRQLEAHKAALLVALNTDAFLRMEEKEQKNLLAGLALPAHYDFDPQIVGEVNKALGPGEINFAGEPFAVINQAYKKLFDERQIVNRQVREFLVPDQLPVPAGVDSHQLQERLTSLRIKRKEGMDRRDHAVAEANKVEVDRASALARIQSLEESIKGYRQRLDPLGGDILLSADRLAYLRRVATGKGELDRLSREKLGADKLLASSIAQRGQLDKIPRSACPACGQSISPEKLVDMRAKLAEQVTEEQGAVALLEQKLKALGEVEEAIALIGRHEAAAKQAETIHAQIKEKQCLLDEAREREDPEPALFDFRPYDQPIAECDAEIEKLNGQLRPAIAAEERRKEVEIKSEQLKRLKAKAALLDGLVKYFDKDGIKAKLLGQYIGGFEHKLNEVLSAWGYACALSIEPYSFDVTNARGDTNPVRELSGAERVMFSLAFQCAVSRTDNLGLVVVDEVAMFLPELRPVLNKRLYEMVQQGYLEQIIMLVADTSEQVPNLAGAAFFIVNDGAVSALQHPKMVLQEAV